MLCRLDNSVDLSSSLLHFFFFYSFYYSAENLLPYILGVFTFISWTMVIIADLKSLSNYYNTWVICHLSIVICRLLFTMRIGHICLLFCMLHFGYIMNILSFML